MSQQTEDTTTAEERTQAEIDLAALQERYGPPQPREPLTGQPPLDLEGVPAYEPPPPPPTTRRGGRRRGRRDG
jgi:hypothetical protein